MYIGFSKLCRNRKAKKKDTICYYGFDGEIWMESGKKHEGPGFATGNVVEVKLLNNGIHW